MPDPTATTDSSISDADLIALLRKRLHDVEQAAQDYLVVTTDTGRLREEAHTKLVAALTTDFRTATLTSHGMTREQRAHWLGESDKHEASTEAAP